MKRHGTEAQYRVPLSNPTLFLAGRFAGDPRHIANEDEAPIVDLERYLDCLGVGESKCHDAFEGSNMRSLTTGVAVGPHQARS